MNATTTNTTWTARHLAAVNAKAEAYWLRYCKAESAGARKHHQRNYERAANAARYLTARMS